MCILYSGTADNSIEVTVTNSGENSTKQPSSDDAPNTSTTDKQEQEIESVLTNSAPPYAERTLSGETVISVTSETGELIPVQI